MWLLLRFFFWVGLGSHDKRAIITALGLLGGLRLEHNYTNEVSHSGLLPNYPGGTGHGRLIFNNWGISFTSSYEYW